MRVTLTSQWEEVLPDLAPAEVKLFLALAFFAGTLIFSFRTHDMEAAAGQSKVTFHKALWKLHKRGIIKITGRNSGANGETTVHLLDAWVSFGGKA